MECQLGGCRDRPAQPLVDGGWPSQRAARTQRVAAGRRPARRQQHATAIGAARRAPARARHPRAPAPAHAGPAPAVRRGPAGVARAGGQPHPRPAQWRSTARTAPLVRAARTRGGRGHRRTRAPRAQWPLAAPAGAAAAHAQAAPAVVAYRAEPRGADGLPAALAHRVDRPGAGGRPATRAPRRPQGHRRSGHAPNPVGRARDPHAVRRQRASRRRCRAAGPAIPRAAPRPGWGSRSSGRSGAAQRAAADQPRGIHPRPRRQQILDLAQVAVHHALIERAQHVGAGMPAGQAIESGARTAGCSSRIRTGGR